MLLLLSWRGKKFMFRLYVKFRSQFPLGSEVQKESYFVPTPVQQDSWSLSRLPQSFRGIQTGWLLSSTYTPPYVYYLNKVNTETSAASWICWRCLYRGDGITSPHHKSVWWHYWVGLINILSENLWKVFVHAEWHPHCSAEESANPSIPRMTWYDNALANVVCAITLAGATNEDWQCEFILVVLQCLFECMSVHVQGVSEHCQSCECLGM